MTQHAKLSPSSAHRWFNCPGSVRLIGALPPEEQDRGSSFADEGSAAHALAERCLSEGKDAREFLGDGIRRDKGGYCVMTGPFDDADFVVDEEMAGAVQVHLDEVRAQMARLPSAEVLLEQRVYPLRSREGIFGTSDVIVLDDLEGELLVYDYKHGAGVVVEVENNEQALIYALGALRRVDAETIERVTIGISQPRAPHADGPIRRWTVAREWLLEWSRELEAAVARTEAPDAPLQPGDWCRFCPAQGTCPALRGELEEEIGVLFEDLTVEPAPKALLPNPDDANQMRRALALAELVEPWAKEVRRMAQRCLESGEPLEGWKLVRTSKHRKWLDAEEVLRVLKSKKGVHRDDYLDVELKSPAQLEKVKALGKEWVAKYAHKPDGDLTLARESDPRPTAQLDNDLFEDLTALPSGTAQDATA